MVATLSGPKLWTVRAMWGHTYPVEPRNTRPATLRSLCNAGLVERVWRVVQHHNGESMSAMGYILTRRGERAAEESAE